MPKYVIAYALQDVLVVVLKDSETTSGVGTHRRLPRAICFSECIAGLISRVSAVNIELIFGSDADFVWFLVVAAVPTRILFFEPSV